MPLLNHRSGLAQPVYALLLRLLSSLLLGSALAAPKGFGQATVGIEGPAGADPAGSPTAAVKPRNGAPAAGRFQFGNLIYTLPEGWSRATHADHVFLYPDDRDELGWISIEVHRGAPKPADCKVWLEARLRQCNDPDEEPEDPPVLERLSSEPFPCWIAGQRIDGEMQMHAAFELKDRIEHLFFRGPIEAQTGALVQRFFTPLCASLAFVSEGAAPLLGAPRPGELDGSYYGLTTGYGLGGVELDHRLLVFWPSGRFFEGFPEGASPLTLDWTATLERLPDRCGNYRVRGKRLELQFADGSQERRSFARCESEGLEIDELCYQPVEPVPDGQRFNGTYQLSSFTSFTPGSGVVGGMGASQSLKLTKTGRFEANALRFAFGNFENGSGDHTGGFANRGEPPRQRGRYRVEQGLLWLAEDGGPEVSRSLFQIEAGMLFVDGEPLLLQEKDG